MPHSITTSFCPVFPIKTTVDILFFGISDILFWFLILLLLGIGIPSFLHCFCIGKWQHFSSADVKSYHSALNLLLLATLILYIKVVQMKMALQLVWQMIQWYCCKLVYKATTNRYETYCLDIGGWNKCPSNPRDDGYLGWRYSRVGCGTSFHRQLGPHCLQISVASHETVSRCNYFLDYYYHMCLIWSYPVVRSASPFTEIATPLEYRSAWHTLCVIHILTINSSNTHISRRQKLHDCTLTTSVVIHDVNDTVECVIKPPVVW